MRSVLVSVVAAGMVMASDTWVHAGCVINTIGTQIFVRCDPEPAPRWRGAGDDGGATRWRSTGPADHGRPRDQIRRFEEVGSVMVEVEPNPDIHMLKIR